MPPRRDGRSWDATQRIDFRTTTNPAVRKSMRRAAQYHLVETATDALGLVGISWVTWVSRVVLALVMHHLQRSRQLSDNFLGPASSALPLTSS